jgi:hypothetical protein
VVVLYVIDDRGSGLLRRLLGENEFKSFEENRREETENMPFFDHSVFRLK